MFKSIYSPICKKITHNIIEGVDGSPTYNLEFNGVDSYGTFPDMVLEGDFEISYDLATNDGSGAIAGNNSVNNFLFYMTNNFLWSRLESSDVNPDFLNSTLSTPISENIRFSLNGNTATFNTSAGEISGDNQEGFGSQVVNRIGTAGGNWFNGTISNLSIKDLSKPIQNQYVVQGNGVDLYGEIPEITLQAGDTIEFDFIPIDAGSSSKFLDSIGDANRFDCKLTVTPTMDANNSIVDVNNTGTNAVVLGKQQSVVITATGNIDVGHIYTNQRADSFFGSHTISNLKITTANGNYHYDLSGQEGDLIRNLAAPEVNKTFDPATDVVSQTRALQASYVDDAGVVRYADIDQPRSDRNGWLYEPESTNNAPYSEDFSRYDIDSLGVGNDPIVTPSNIPAPDGSMNAYDCYFDCVGSTSSDISRISYFSGNDIGDDVSNSFFGRTKTGTTTLRYSLSGSNAKIITLTTEWKRFENIVLDATQQNRYLRLETVGGLTDTVADVVLFGNQHEIRKQPTSYIPTNGTAVTRPADVVILDQLDGAFTAIDSQGNKELVNVIDGQMVLDKPVYIDRINRSDGSGLWYNYDPQTDQQLLPQVDRFYPIKSKGSDTQPDILGDGSTDMTLFNVDHDNDWTNTSGISVSNINIIQEAIMFLESQGWTIANTILDKSFEVTDVNVTITKEQLLSNNLDNLPSPLKNDIKDFLNFQ